jgi:hypothetical protein
MIDELFIEEEDKAITRQMAKKQNKAKEVQAKKSKKSKEELKVDLSAQRTYGHFTFEALYSMIDYMQKPTMIDKLTPLDDKY